MVAKQLSVFIENKKGRLEEVLTVLKNNKINIFSISLADTSDYGLLRLIVSDVELGKDKLKEAGFSSMVNSILAVKIEHHAGSLQELLRYLSDCEINVEYMYGLSIVGKDATIALKVSDFDKATQILQEKGVTMLSYEDILNSQN